MLKGYQRRSFVDLYHREMRWQLNHFIRFPVMEWREDSFPIQKMNGKFESSKLILIGFPAIWYRQILFSIQKSNLPYISIGEVNFSYIFKQWKFQIRKKLYVDFPEGKRLGKILWQDLALLENMTGFFRSSFYEIVRKSSRSLRSRFLLIFFQNLCSVKNSSPGPNIWGLIPKSFLIKSTIILKQLRQLISHFRD